MTSTQEHTPQYEVWAREYETDTTSELIAEVHTPMQADRVTLFTATADNKYSYVQWCKVTESGREWLGTRRAPLAKVHALVRHIELFEPGHDMYGTACDYGCEQVAIGKLRLPQNSGVFLCPEHLVHEIQSSIIDYEQRLAGNES